MHTRNTSQVTSHTSHVTRHTSHATRHMSHVIRHMSHVTRYTPHLELALIKLDRACGARRVTQVKEHDLLWGLRPTIRTHMRLHQRSTSQLKQHNWDCVVIEGVKHRGGLGRIVREVAAFRETIGQGSCGWRVTRGREEHARTHTPAHVSLINLNTLSPAISAACSINRLCASV